MLTFETERLVMRIPGGNPTLKIFTTRKTRIVGPAAGWKPAESFEESFKTLQEFCKKPDEVCAVMLKETGRAIGRSACIRRKGDGTLSRITRMLGYVLDEPYWGRGYMTEAVRGALRFAFDEMELELVSVYHFPV